MPSHGDRLKTIDLEGVLIGCASGSVLLAGDMFDNNTTKVGYTDI